MARSNHKDKSTLTPSTTHCMGDLPTLLNMPTFGIKEDTSFCKLPTPLSKDDEALLREKADKASFRAQIWLGIMYSEGKRLRKSPLLAARYTKLAAGHGDSGSCQRLAKMYATGTGVKQSDALAHYYQDCAKEFAAREESRAAIFARISECDAADDLPF